MPPADPVTNKYGNVYPTQSVTDAADKYGVPQNILWGVYGMETDFGQNIATSSAGAIGGFQFLPSTARGYSYPLTNTPSAAQFQAQADGAAHYLHDLYAQYGSWDEALKHYSGGGYGLSQVEDKAGEHIPDPGQSPAGKAKDAVTGTADSVGSALSGLLAFLTDIQTWVRIGEAIAGMALIYFGLKELTA